MTRKMNIPNPSLLHHITNNFRYSPRYCNYANNDRHIVILEINKLLPILYITLDLKKQISIFVQLSKKQPVSNLKSKIPILE